MIRETVNEIQNNNTQNHLNELSSISTNSARITPPILPINWCSNCVSTEWISRANLYIPSVSNFRISAHSKIPLHISDETHIPFWNYFKYHLVDYQSASSPPLYPESASFPQPFNKLQFVFCLQINCFFASLPQQIVSDSCPLPLNSEFCKMWKSANKTLSVHAQLSIVLILTLIRCILYQSLHPTVPLHHLRTQPFISITAPSPFTRSDNAFKRVSLVVHPSNESDHRSNSQITAHCVASELMMHQITKYHQWFKRYLAENRNM